MSDLTTRLLAAIGETERIARAAIAALEDDEVEAAAWKADNVYGDDSGHPTEFDVWFGYIPDDSTIVRFYVQHSDVARHIALHDPASVLRRCAADRKIVEGCQETLLAVADGSEDYDAGVVARFVLHTLAEGYGIEAQT